MKKFFKIYRNRYMIRPTVYQTVYRCLAALVLSLLWSRYMDQNGRGVSFALQVFGIILCIFSWFRYLGLDGVHIFPSRQKDKDQTRKKRFHLPDIIDFTDERVSPMDELEEEEKTACRLASDLISGAVLILAGVICAYV
ncbi:MAG: hypothetical protein LUG61_04045 [Lachnospiraceae bacterium]|nr:hypothetical protein [Lachnospiraceae bacterium]